MKHPGFVFVDGQGHAWGWSDVLNTLACGIMATRPFKTKEAATIAGKMAPIYRAVTVRKWLPTDRVPPLHNKQPEN